MQIDIRNEEVKQITSIIFHGHNCNPSDAYELVLDNSLSKLVSYADGNVVFIDSKEHALNLIKALQEAIELENWG